MLVVSKPRLLDLYQINVRDVKNQQEVRKSLNLKKKKKFLDLCVLFYTYILPENPGMDWSNCPNT